jgi:hypothetical protein
MIRTIFSKSGLSITGDEIYQIVNGRLRAIQADTTNNQVVVYLEEKDGSGTTNSGTTERLFFDVGSGSEALAAEDIISMINGLSKNSQIGKISDSTQDYSVAEVTGVKIPVFTIANTDTTITGTATDDFTFTLASATPRCDFSATLSMDDESHEFTVTGTDVTATEAITFDSTDFSAGDATIAITLTNPNQPSSTRVVSQAATIA